MNVNSRWIERYTHGDEIVSRRFEFTTYRDFAKVVVVEHSDAMPEDAPPVKVLSMGMSRREMEALRETLDRAILDMMA